MDRIRERDDLSPDYYRGIEDSMGALLSAAEGEETDKAQLIKMMTSLLCEAAAMRAVTFHERFKTAFKEG
jgi:hypothetical protein